MLAATNADEKQSVKKMEANDELRTIECLRGRLLAERAASKLANENANLIGNKLIELENKLRKEIKSKNKAKKKLKFLMKKIESMKINYVSESSYPCTSTSSSTSSASVTKHPKEEDQILKSMKINYVSESSYSCTSSSSSTSSASAIKHPKEEEEEDQVPKSQFSDSEKCNSSITEINQNSSENTLSSSNCDYDDASVENSRQPESIQSCKNSQNDDDDQSIKSSMRGRMEINEENSNNGEEEDNDDCVDKSLALVLVPPNIEAEAPPPPSSSSQKCEMKIVEYKSVGEVLDALRHAREMLQSSMDNKRYI